MKDKNKEKIIFLCMKSKTILYLATIRSYQDGFLPKSSNLHIDKTNIYFNGTFKPCRAISLFKYRRQWFCMPNAY